MNIFKKGIIIVKKVILGRIIGKSFTKKLIKLMIMEEFEPAFLSQVEFKTCQERAAAVIDMATEPEKTKLGYAIAYHRVKAHNDMTYEKEMNTTKSSLSSKDQKTMAAGWWLG